MANFVKHAPCPGCGSKDNLAVYDDGSYYCFAECGYKSVSEEFKRGSKQDGSKGKTKESSERMELEKIITDEQREAIKAKAGFVGMSYRGITDETLKYFGCLTELDGDEVKARYYPVTYNGKIAGFKCRKHPKTFGGSVGETGKNCDMYGQFRFTEGGKYCLIVGGEEDVHAAYQMLADYNKSKGWDYRTAVVSSTIGEKGTGKQAKINYNFFNKFDQIIIGLDADEAGEEAIAELVAALPKGKVKIAKWRKGKFKDPNDYLKHGASREFIADFYNAKLHVPTGVVGSNQISEDMRKELLVPKMTLPAFMHKLQERMAGGIPLGRIVNLGSASGTGKSTIVDEVIYHWIFEGAHPIGIVTLESTTGQYGLKLLSRHISKKIELLPGEEALALLDTDEVKQKEYELFNKEDGSPRFWLVDDRDGGVEAIKDAVENLIISCGCKVIVLDPVSDLIAKLGNDQQEEFMEWQKSMVKSHHVTFMNVCHTRKTGSGQKAGSEGADLHEEDIIGSSSIYKSAACNLMFGRNKEAEDPVERNTTNMKATKIRWTGKTGMAGRYFYDIETHTMYDLDDWMAENDYTPPAKEVNKEFVTEF